MLRDAPMEPNYISIFFTRLHSMSSAEKKKRKKQLWSARKSFHKAPHMEGLIEINLTASDPIISVIYNCFSLRVETRFVLAHFFGHFVISRSAF